MRRKFQIVALWLEASKGPSLRPLSPDLDSCVARRLEGAAVTAFCVAGGHTADVGERPAGGDGKGRGATLWD